MFSEFKVNCKSLFCFSFKYFSSQLQHFFRFWRVLYCRFESGVHPRENLDEVVLATADHSRSLEDHINFLQKVCGYCLDLIVVTLRFVFINIYVFPQKVNVIKQIVSNSKDKIKGFVEDQLERVTLNDKSSEQVIYCWLCFFYESRV